VDEVGTAADKRGLRRSQVLGCFAKLPPCLVGMAARGTAHRWASQIHKLNHEVRLMPAQFA
jgi:transposase